MGSFVELNDTLQITKEQGFPPELDLEKHVQTPFTAEDFKDTIFEFHDKPGVRIYHLPPVRNFFAENRDGKWIYWGLVHIVETTCDYIAKTTSGKFKIIYINTPDEMKKAHELIDRRSETQYFK
ncbi:MAG TPA: hypothetical protein VND99_05260 [Candidatus Acidoferrales bacterium]|nr:hypothetical protein [Candidatus Acidoferrales bacterium]